MDKTQEKMQELINSHKEETPQGVNTAVQTNKQTNKKTSKTK